MLLKIWLTALIVFAIYELYHVSILEGDFFDSLASTIIEIALLGYLFIAPVIGLFVLIWSW